MLMSAVFLGFAQTVITTWCCFDDRLVYTEFWPSYSAFCRGEDDIVEQTRSKFILW